MRNGVRRSESVDDDDDDMKLRSMIKFLQNHCWFRDRTHCIVVKCPTTTARVSIVAYCLANQFSVFFEPLVDAVVFRNSNWVLLFILFHNSTNWWICAMNHSYASRIAELIHATSRSWKTVEFHQESVMQFPNFHFWAIILSPFLFRQIMLLIPVSFML